MIGGVGVGVGFATSPPSPCLPGCPDYSCSAPSQASTHRSLRGASCGPGAPPPPARGCKGHPKPPVRRQTPSGGFLWTQQEHPQCPEQGSGGAHTPPP